MVVLKNLRSFLRAAVMVSAATASLSVANAAGEIDPSRVKKKPTRSMANLMRSIDLRGMKIIEVGRTEVDDQFGYPLRVREDIEGIVDTLTNEIYGDQEIVSRIFELSEPSSFKNIYVFVAGKGVRTSKPVFALYTVFEAKDGSMFMIDYDVVSVAKDERSLVLNNGPRNAETTYRLTTGNRLFGQGPK